VARISTVMNTKPTPGAGGTPPPQQ
jgi:hypothetical protein